MDKFDIAYRMKHSKATVPIRLIVPVTINKHCRYVELDLETLVYAGTMDRDGTEADEYMISIKREIAY